MKFKWWMGVAIVLVGVGGWWIYAVASAPVPGKNYPDQGREHVTPDAVSAFHYNSTPPSSGPHVPTWVNPGIYDEPQSKGELIHSLEHGYVEIHYNCNAGATSDPAATASAVNSSQACTSLVKNLTTVAQKKKLWKLLVVPQPALTTPIALVAWTYLDQLPVFDGARIERFVDFHRDHGPEQTME
jgi:hypothetical protein